MQKWATYNQVTPPIIEQDFFKNFVNRNKPIEDLFTDLYNFRQPEQSEPQTIVIQAPEIGYSTPETTDTESPETKSSNTDNTEKEQPDLATKKKEEAKKIVDSKTQSKFSSNQEFVKVVYNLYKEELARQGLDTNLALMLTAQDALECAWGKSIKGKHNLGNITTNGSDWSVKTGKHHWKDFSSLQEYIKYKLKFLQNQRYKFFTYASASSITSSMQKLANQGYCPNSPTYGSKISSVANTVQKYLNQA